MIASYVVMEEKTGEENVAGSELWKRLVEFYWKNRIRLIL